MGLFFAFAGLMLSIGGIMTNAKRKEEQNRRQQQTLQQDIEFLEQWYDNQEDIYEANQARATESAERAERHVTASATARMEDLREDRDSSLDNAQARTEMAANDMLSVAIGTEQQSGAAEAAAGFSGLERSGTLEQGLEQTQELGEFQVEKGTAQLDLQRTQGFQQSYGFERGAVRTGEELGRQIESIDQQYTNQMDQMEEQWGMLGSQYQHDLMQANDQLQWLKDDKQNIGVDLIFDVLGAGIEFGGFAFEYDLFTATPTVDTGPGTSGGYNDF